MSKVWNIGKPDERAIGLADQLGVSILVADLLVKRGICACEEARRYLRPDISDLHDPLMMAGIADATDYLTKAIADGWKMCIYGDFDVDGLTSTALLFEVIEELGGKVFPFIPDRFRHGYGLNAGIISQLKEKEYDLLVTVDNGISNFDEVAAAKDLGLKVIITDHHEPPKDLPPADVIINPKQPDCNYPFKELAGVGVAFKLAQSLCAGFDREELALDKLDLVALGTIADMTPLVDENRVLSYIGLKKLNDLTRPGIKSLKAVSGLSGDITSSAVSFTIAPRLNASGRMLNARDGLDTLLEKDKSVADDLAAKLQRYNDQRQRIEQKVFKEALEQVESLKLGDGNSVVVSDENWHEGVKGIVASRLVERYGRPSIVFAYQDGFLKGSGRGIPAIDLNAALSKCEDIIDSYGGHSQAAGLKLDPARLDEFRKKFEEVCAEALRNADMIPTLEIDGDMDLSMIDDGLLDDISMLAPFGAENPVPRFRLKDVFIEDQRYLSAGKHIKFLAQNEGYSIEVVGFRPEKIEMIYAHRSSADLIFEIEKRTWRGSSHLQLKLIDIDLKDEADCQGQGFNDLYQELITCLPSELNYEDIFKKIDDTHELPKIHFIDRRGSDNDDYLKKIIGRSQRSLVCVRDPKSAIIVSEKLRELSGRPRLFPLHGGLSKEAKEKLVKAYQSDTFSIAASQDQDISAIGDEIDHLIFLHPPYSLVSLSLILSKVKKKGTSLFVHLLFGREELDATLDIVGRSYPSRGDLVRVYRQLSEGSYESGGPKESVPLKILDELGLISMSEKGQLCLKDSKKVDLDSSLIFQECTTIRSDIDSWAKTALTMTPSKIAKYLTSL